MRSVTGRNNFPQVGQLNKRLEILKLESDDNNVGGRNNLNWEVESKTWGMISNLNGRERFEMNQSQAELTHKIVIRYREDIDRTNNIRYGNRVFEIDYIVDLEEAKRFLVLYVNERV